MSEPMPRANLRIFYVIIILLCIVVVAVTTVFIVMIIDRNDVIRRNDELAAAVEELRAQASEDADKLTASVTAVAGLQSELETAKADAKTQLQALQSEYDADQAASAAALEELQQKYDADMAEAADTLAAAQEDAAQTQAALNAKISELTSAVALLSQTPAPDTPEPEADVVEVSDAVSFLAAIRPNRTIRLLPGDYDLSSDVVTELLDTAGAGRIPYVYYNDLYSMGTLNSGVVITHVDNLTIIADDPQEIYTKNTDDTVLIFEACDHISVSGITFGHKPDTATACIAAVIGLSYCSDISFDGCDLYGCGVEGAYIEDSSSVTFTDSIIRDCTNMAAYVYDGVDISFIGTEIYGIGTDSEYVQTLMQIGGNSRNITVRECNIHDNGNLNTNSPTAMFLVFTKKDELTVTGCKMNNNHYDRYIQ